MIYSIETEKPLPKLSEDLQKACGAHKFGVLSTINLKEKMKEKGVEYLGECLIFEVCNPVKAKTVLEAVPEISTVLPCRISAFKTREGKTCLAMIRPGMLVGMFGSAELRPVADEVESTLVAIMNEAAR